MDLTQIIELTSVFVFALTGALVASRAQLDIVGFVFFACLTGVGGGTFRDLVLGRSPVFWVTDPTSLYVASIAAIIVFFVAPLLESRYRWLIWLDAAALSIAVPAGVTIALQAQQTWSIVLLMGVATGTFGGLLRDVIANEVPILLHKGEMYASAALGGAAMCPICLHFGLSLAGSLWVVAGVTFLLRVGSLALGWKLPTYKSRAPVTSPPDSRQ